MAFKRLWMVANHLAGAGSVRSPLRAWVPGMSHGLSATPGAVSVRYFKQVRAVRQREPWHSGDSHAGVFRVIPLEVPACLIGAGPS